MKLSKVWSQCIALTTLALLLGACAPAPTVHSRASYTSNIDAYQPKHYSNAFNYFHSRAMRGDVVAQNNLGHMYMDGRGVASDPSKAVYWYNQAANQHYRAAEVNLGVAYLYGRGTPKNKKKACYWFAQARMQGSREASDFYRRKC